MLKAVGLARALISLPGKIIIYSGIAGLGLLGVALFSPRFAEVASQAVARTVSWASSSTDEATFDPKVHSSPEKELALIRSVKSEVEPQLTRARVLIRKEQAEIELLREQARFLEKGKTDAAASSGIAAAVKLKAEALEKSMEGLLELQARVLFLDARLEERRLATLQFVPQRSDGNAGGGQAQDVSPEQGEARSLLDAIHQRLFTVLYALDQSLLNDKPQP